MCLICHEQPPLNPTEVVPITDAQLAADHRDGIAACIRYVETRRGSSSEWKIQDAYHYCIDCGEIVEGTDHCCYD